VNEIEMQASAEEGEIADVQVEVEAEVARNPS